MTAKPPQTLRYADGEPVKLGDALIEGSDAYGLRGRVVGILQQREFASGYRAEGWPMDEFPEGGVLVESPKFGLVLYSEEEDMARLRRDPSA